MTKAHFKKRQVRRHKGSVTFRGKTYWFYGDYFLRYRKRLTRGLKVSMTALRGAGYKVRLVRPTLSYNIVEIYTSPKVPGPHLSRFDRIM